MSEWKRPKAEKWKFRVVDLSNMDILIDEKYTDKELIQTLATATGVRGKGAQLPHDQSLGVSFGIRIEEITNFDNLIKRYYNVVIANESGYKQSWELKKTDASRRGWEKGHPDYILAYSGPEDTGHKEDIVYLELKRNGDTIRNGQLEWMLEHCTEGYSVYLLNVETPDYRS